MAEISRRRREGSNPDRIGLQFSYNLVWLRQKRTSTWSCPLEIARTLPIELLRLMGYQCGVLDLGYVGDMMDLIPGVPSEIENDAPEELENPPEMR